VTIVAGTGVLTINGNVAGNGNNNSEIIKQSTGALSGTGTLTNVNDLTISAATTILAGTDLTFTGNECRLDANAAIINNGSLTFNSASCASSRVINIANGITFT